MEKSKNSTGLFFTLVLLFMFISLSTFSQEDPSKWTYFRIYVYVSEDPVFQIVLDELNVTEKLESYTLVVNFKDPSNSYILIGMENDPAAKEKWDAISQETRDKLTSWSKPNKVNLSN